MGSKYILFFAGGLSLALGAACHRTRHQPPGGWAPSQAAVVASRAIRPEYLRDQVARLSSDAMEGRAPGTRGDVAARAYLGEQLRALGAAPGLGDGAWEQPVDLVSVTTTMPEAWIFERGAGRLALRRSDEFIATTGTQAEHGAIDRVEVVFVGYGIEAPEYAWDDFKGRDVHAKILLVLNNDPDWDPALFAGKTRLYYGRWTYKFENAARHGAAGALIVHTTPSAGYPFQVVRSTWGGAHFELPSHGEPRLALQGWVTEEAARALAKLGGLDLDRLTEEARTRSFAPIPLGIGTSVRFESRIERSRSANVVGVLRGRDPRLADEYVVLSAHHDHLGIGAPNAAGDAIYNGALDNAAGDAQVLAITRALSALPARTRRSVLILFSAAEEQGLLGSRYFAEHPPVSPDKLVAVLNYDGGNIWGRTRDISQIGAGKSSLDEVVARVARWQGRVVKGDEFPDRGTLYRSDQFSFARIGVPPLYMKPGTDFVGHPPDWGRQQILDYEAHDYHQPSDELRPSWNFEGMVEDACFGFFAAVDIAEAPEAPTWVPGDEFERARKPSGAAPSHP
jgi:Zn-dependent M28 family amino/carboxypeptidase